MPRTEEQFAAMRTESKTRIIDAALYLFSHQGYHTTSMERIAAEAKISKGLIYNYFKSKRELLDAIVAYGFDQIDALLAPPDENMLPTAVLRYEIENTFTAVMENFTFWKLYFALVMQPDVISLLGDQFANMHREQIQNMRQLLERTGALHPRRDAYVIAALLDGIFFHYMLDPEYPLEEIRNEVIKLYCGD